MPTTFGKYEILETVGQGGMGTVHRARNTVSGRMVALKMMRGGMVVSEQSRQRFMQEARAMARLRHRNIVGVYEVDEVDGVPYLAMEFIEGRRLSDVLADGIPKPRQAATWMIKIARALAHAHEKGLIHRDLKPGNVIINTQGEPIVLDFGLAKDVIADPGITSPDEIIGTPGFMSPEQVEGRHLDHRSDIFSLGSLFYSLLTARPPFSGPRKASVMYQVAHTDPDPPSSVNSDCAGGLEVICLKAMRRDPDERYQSAADFVSDLQAQLRDLPITAKPESRVMRAVRVVRREKRTVVLGLAGAGAVAVVLILVLNGGSGSPPSLPSSPPPSPPDPLAGIDQLILAERYDEAEQQCRAARTAAADPAVIKAIDNKLALIQTLRAAAAPTTRTATTGPADAVQTECRRVMDLVSNKKYDEAIAACDALLGGTLTADQQSTVRQLKAWAESLRDTGGTAPPPAGTVAAGDRLLRACKFEEAASAYATAGADQTRKDLAARLLALRNTAAQALGGAGAVPVTLTDGSRATLSAINRTGPVMAAAGGTVGANTWEAMKPGDVYRIYQACQSSPTATDHLNLGALCHALGLAADARRELDEAVRGNASLKPEADRIAALTLAR